MDERETYDGMESAVAQIAALRELGVEDDRWSEERVDQIVGKFNAAASKAESIADDSTVAYSISKPKYKLGRSMLSMVNTFNLKLKHNPLNSGEVILEAAVPFTRYILSTVKKFMNIARSKTRQVHKRLQRTVNETAVDNVESARDVHKTLLSQTSEVSGEIRQLANDAIGSLLMAFPEQASEDIDSVTSCLTELQELTAEKATGVLNHAKTASGELLREILGTKEVRGKIRELLTAVDDSSRTLAQESFEVASRIVGPNLAAKIAKDVFGKLVDVDAHLVDNPEVDGVFLDYATQAFECPERGIEFASRLIRNGVYSEFEVLEEKMKAYSSAVALNNTTVGKEISARIMECSSETSAFFVESTNAVVEKIKDTFLVFGGALYDKIGSIVDGIDAPEARTTKLMVKSMSMRGWGWSSIVNSFKKKNDDNEESEDSDSSGTSVFWNKIKSAASKVKDSVTNAVDKVKDTAKSAKDSIVDKVKSFFGGKTDDAEKEADDEDNDDDEQSDAEKLFGENFSKKNLNKAKSPLADDPDWINDPDIQQWSTESSDDFLNDDDDDDDDDEDEEDEDYPDEDEEDDDYDPVNDPDSPYYDPDSPFYDSTKDPSSDDYIPPSDSDYNPVADPNSDQYDPESALYDPKDDPTNDPNSPEYNPYSPNYDPKSDPTNDPSSPDYDPTSPYYDPASDPTNDPSSPYYDPDSPFYDPESDPSSGSYNPSKSPYYTPDPLDIDPDAATTPMSPDSPPSDKGLHETQARTRKMGWKRTEPEVVTGLDMLMHDGDQQLLNPYGPVDAGWTIYSFRPKDVNESPYYPQISITPASFEAIASMDDMLNSIPYVVVKEYFFKNTASTMLNFVKKIAGLAKEAFQKPSKVDNTDEISSESVTDVAGTGGGFLDLLKEKFKTLTLKQTAIEMPYILYCGLRKKLYGNTYIFPYIVTQSTVINEASNTSEWNGKEGGFVDGLKQIIQGASNMVADFSMGIIGSQASAAKLFPAPTWANTGQDGVSFAFDLILINDHVIKARNNYMCVNTIIHNNRSMQKAILAFPGALYEVWLPTGQRHLMCSGDFKLFPLGLNRATPNGFFKGPASVGAAANFSIGVNDGSLAKIENPENKGHVDGQEVIPDAYKLQINFKSCLANNLNTSVFQYYVKMTGYGDYKNENVQGGKEDPTTVPTSADEMMAGTGASDYKNEKPESGSGGGGENKSTRGSKTTIAKEFSRAIADLVDSVESFEESTYNKKLEKIKSSFGEQAINADSVVLTVRKSQKVIRETNSFLSKLYNAENNNLWYKPVEQEEIYTTLKPDYRQLLRKKYGINLDKVRQVQARIQTETEKLEMLESRLRGISQLDERNTLLESKLESMKRLTELKSKREELTDEIIQIDTDLLQIAFDEHDKAVSVKKNDVTFRIFKQVWNEKIMNSYERDKLQYLTSVEKERYFQEKIRDLRKYDTYGVLNHPDWFFRVVVLDFIVAEMQKLIFWFKNCSYDDFDTIYRIMRKLNLLQLDVEAARSVDKFDINRTNLFYLSDDDMREFTKVDGMLTGNTLYQLFQSQVKLNMVEESSSTGGTQEDESSKDKELVQERKSDIQSEQQRTVRQDVVTRFWGSESNLTRCAYEKVNKGADKDIYDELPEEIRSMGISTLKELKEKILDLKLNDPENEKLQTLLGAFTNQVSNIKEQMVIEKMNEMRGEAQRQIENKDGSVYAKTIDTGD